MDNSFHDGSAVNSRANSANHGATAPIHDGSAVNSRANSANHGATAPIHDGSAVNSRANSANHGATAPIHDGSAVNSRANSATTMKQNTLVSLSKEFAIDIINLCTEIKNSYNGNVLINQLLRSGTSIGANIHEGNYASSRADFINKFQISLKECYETEYWLEIFSETAVITAEEYAKLYSKCSKIRKLLTASITTAKSNND